MNAADQDKNIHRLSVRAADGGYEVVIGAGLLREADRYIADAVGTGMAVLVVTDEDVQAAGHCATLETALRRTYPQTTVASVPAGERSKSFEQATRLYGECVRAGLDRRSLVLALGGGVVGDLAGFVAATYMRGVRFIQVPTTLLAHDSSIGGKVAVDLPEGKNLVGAFHAPKLVLFDAEALRTLPMAERSNGLAEAIKHGVIRDPELFAFIEERVGHLLAGAGADLTELLHRSCAVKVAVVNADEKETGLRAILNFGHTIGHAVEAFLAPRCPHGAAISLGMIAETWLAQRLGLCDGEFLARLVSLLGRAGLPNAWPDELRGSVTADALVELMRHDKKAANRSLAFVLPRKLGEVEIYPSLSEADVRAALTSAP